MEYAGIGLAFALVMGGYVATFDWPWDWLHLRFPRQPRVPDDRCVERGDTYCTHEGLHDWELRG